MALNIIMQRHRSVKSRDASFRMEELVVQDDCGMTGNHGLIDWTLSGKENLARCGRSESLSDSILRVRMASPPSARGTLPEWKAIELRRIRGGRIWCIILAGLMQPGLSMLVNMQVTKSVRYILASGRSRIQE